MWFGLVASSAMFVAAILTFLSLRLLRVVRRLETLVAEVRKEQSEMQEEVMLRARLLEESGNVNGWLTLYMFIPQSSDYDYCDFVLERVRHTLDYCGSLERSLHEHEKRRLSRTVPDYDVGGPAHNTSHSLMERSNAFQLVKSKFYKEPFSPTGSSGESSVAEGGACAVGQGPRQERPVEPDSSGGVS